MATTPNARNKQDMRAKAEAAAVASTCEFLKLKSTEAQQIYALYLQGIAEHKPAKTVIEEIKNYLIGQLGLLATVASAIAPVAYDRCVSGAFQKTLLDAAVFEIPESPEAVPTLSLTLEDYQKFTEFCATLPDLSANGKALLLALIVFYRKNFHPSYWVRYDRKNIFYLAGLHQCSPVQQEALTRYLHKYCGLNMRVIGSKQPIVCYDFVWMHEQAPADDSKNPILNLGPLTQTTLQNVVSKITTEL